MAAGTVVGGILSVADPLLILGDRTWMWTACGAAFCLGGAANAINDHFDINVDRVNRPDRPLASGRLSRDTGLVAWLLLTTLGVFLSFMLSIYHGAVALLVSWLMFAYSASVKRKSVYGNLLVALVVSLVIFYGAIEFGITTAVVCGIVFAFLTTLAREIIKDMEDEGGDRSSGSVTIPIKYGSGFAGRLVLLLCLVIVALLPLPYWSFDFNGVYLLGTVACGILALVAAWTAVSATDRQRYRLGSSLIKITMVIGLASLAVAQVQWY